MTARSLLAVFDSLYLLALAGWVGSALVHAFIAGPITSKVLEPEAERRLARAFLPRYYALGAIAGAIALPAYLGGPLSFPEYRGPHVALASLGLIAGTLISLYGGNSLVPALEAAAQADVSGEGSLRRLKRRAGWLDGLRLLVGAALLVAFATRPAPRTSGIRELTPAERARYEAEAGRAIEQIEAGRGLRALKPDGRDRPALSPEELRELRGYYDRKFGSEAGPGDPARALQTPR